MCSVAAARRPRAAGSARRPGRPWCGCDRRARRASARRRGCRPAPRPGRAARFRCARRFRTSWCALSSLRLPMCCRYTRTRSTSSRDAPPASGCSSSSSSVFGGFGGERLVIGPASDGLIGKRLGLLVLEQLARLDLERLTFLRVLALVDGQAEVLGAMAPVEDLRLARRIPLDERTALPPGLERERCRLRGFCWPRLFDLQSGCLSGPPARWAWPEVRGRRFLRAVCITSFDAKTELWDSRWDECHHFGVEGGSAQWPARTVPAQRNRGALRRRRLERVVHRAFEQHASVDEARHRADELWMQLVAQDGTPVLASR